MDIAVVGAGRVGTALAVLWAKAGHTITAVSGRAATRERAERYLPGVPLADAATAPRDADVVVIATPDVAIAAACADIAGGGNLAPGTAVAHVSGATGLEALDAARSAGATTLSLHPLQTCPTVEAALERLPGATFAVTSGTPDGLEVGERLALDAGGRPFELDDAAKGLYHAAAVFASNYLVTITALAEELERAAGVPDPAGALAPLQEATMANVARVGPAEALTGPAVRGDAGTVARNLEALARDAPQAVRPYVVLADVALDLAERSGRLAAEGRDAVEEVLARWR
ncbi:MAG TPA: Rossmann-like and DUF2520 domain-containing protein [Actinomycetota bacterium]|nr:Rossmann-like and DUF2520 domain-containing protein [Actinomycetota bacterium]